MGKYIAEFIGPFALVFAGAGTIIATGGQNLVAIALAHGLAIGVMVAAAGHVSGGVYNPALTAGLWITGKLGTARAIGYVIAQLFGGLVAAWVLKAVFPQEAIDAVRLGTPLLADGVNPGAGTLVELVTTFFLMYTVFGAAIDPRGPKATAGLAIGLAITTGVLVGGGLTGAAMNPARHFGPALASGAWTHWWVYWVGPILGAGIAAVVYNGSLLSEREPRAAEGR